MAMRQPRTVLRRATEREIRSERAANPADFWHQVYLDLSPEIVARAAERLWGPAVASGTDGEVLWKLWSPALGVPVYIAVGLTRPAALFSSGLLPRQDDAERLVRQIREVLVQAESPAAMPRSAPSRDGR